MFIRRDTLFATIIFSLMMASAANAGQAKQAAGGAKSGAPGGATASAPAEPCQTNGVIDAANTVNTTATSVGKTADTLGKTADTVSATSDKLDTMETKMNKVFAGFKPGAKTPPPAKPATTTTTATATPPAKPPAKPAATPAPAAATKATSTVANAQSALAGAPGAAGASGGGGGAPCTPANKFVGGGGISGTPVAISAPPTFTAMPDGDYMLGYVAPGGKQPTYAKVKEVQNPAQATPAYPRDGIYSDGKMYYMVTNGKLVVAQMASGGGSSGGGAAGGGEPKALAPAPAPAAVAVPASAPAGPVSGLVADITGSDIIINVGTSTGVKVGSTLDVVRPRVIKDPATGKELKTVDTKLGTLIITSADATSASGKYTGTATKVGDTVKAPQ